jgi:hypothetical protein
MAVAPEIVPGVAGSAFTITANVCGVLEPQVLSAVTVTLPLVALAVVVILFVELVPLHPPGKVHEYAVAPLTGTIEYVLLLPEQMAVVPEMLPGLAGMVFTVTANVCGLLDPQVLSAVTVIFPLLALAVVMILIVVLVPVHPPGTVQE